eukprot:3105647-Pyramimonas_sp.AAC.1
MISARGAPRASNSVASPRRNPWAAQRTAPKPSEFAAFWSHRYNRARLARQKAKRVAVEEGHGGRLLKEH